MAGLRTISLPSSIMTPTENAQGNNQDRVDPDGGKDRLPGGQASYSQSSSLSSSALRASLGLLGAWLGLPELAPTTS